MTTDLQSLATHARSFFTVKTRATRRCRCLDIDTAPKWVRELIRLAHDGMFQDDYKYQFVVDALDAIAGADDCCIVPDSDTCDLLAWAASHVNREIYCDHYMELTGSKYTKLAHVLRGGQYTERAEVRQIVCKVLEAQLVVV